MKTLPATFPPGLENNIDYDNPGIRLYGNRFYKDQSPIEYVAEFITLLFSRKIVGNATCEEPLPDITMLLNWPSGEHLKYESVPIRLLLKLFAFCSKTNIDKRYDFHEEKYKDLLDVLKARIKVSYGNQDEIIDALQELFAGLMGAGADRNWCARTFFPLAECLLSQEVISNDINTRKKIEGKNKEGKNLSWIETIDPQNINTYYSLSRHRFLARGGEELYLQLCNLFSQPPDKIKKWSEDIGLDEYDNINELHKSLNDRFKCLRGTEISGLNELGNFIEQLDEETWTKLKEVEKNRKLKCEWCPQETWPESLFFAIELNNILTANFDPVERVEQLKYACSLQVLRTLCAQSMRYLYDYQSNYKRANSPLGYLWIMTPIDADKTLKIPAVSNLTKITDVIYNSLRHPSLKVWEEKASKIKSKDSLYREADDSYGHSMFLFLGKTIELIIPRKGPGARLVLNDQLIRYLVSSLLKPGEQVEYRDFLRRLYIHYGIAIEGEELLEAIEWSGHPRPTVQPHQSDWFPDLLRKGGFMIELSDACSIVHNPFF